MFRKLLKNKKAQQTAEYALLIALVVAAVIAMQTYAQRTIQGRIRDASMYLTRQTSALGTTNQYEPYYLTTDYNVLRDDRTRDTQVKSGTDVQVRLDILSNRTREAGGYTESSYNTGLGLINGL